MFSVLRSGSERARRLGRPTYAGTTHFRGEHAVIDRPYRSDLLQCGAHCIYASPACSTGGVDFADGKPATVSGFATKIGSAFRIAGARSAARRLAKFMPSGCFPDKIPFQSAAAHAAIQIYHAKCRRLYWRDAPLKARAGRMPLFAIYWDKFRECLQVGAR